MELQNYNMSENTKPESPRVTEKQLQKLATIAKLYFRGTASTVIEINGDFPFLNAVGKGDKALATKLLGELMNAIAEKQAKWKSEHPLEIALIA